MTPARRAHDAVEKLVEWADRSVGMPFEWGKTDCGALFLQALALLDVDGARHFERITWSTAWGAFKALELDTPEAWIIAAGARELAVADVASGDLVTDWIAPGMLPDVPAGIALPSCYVAIGSRILSSSVQTGVALIPRRDLIAAHTLGAELRAWRID